MVPNRLCHLKEVCRPVPMSHAKDVLGNLHRSMTLAQCTMSAPPLQSNPPPPPSFTSLALKTLKSEKNLVILATTKQRCSVMRSAFKLVNGRHRNWPLLGGVSAPCFESQLFAFRHLYFNNNCVKIKLKST